MPAAVADRVGIVGRPKGEEPPKINVATRLPKDLFEWVERTADRDERTVSQVVYFAVKEYRERHEKKGDKSK